MYYGGYNKKITKHSPDQDLLQKVILSVLVETNKNNDRSYLDTIKRILEGNERSKIASKYTHFYFFRRFPNISRWALKETLDTMVEQNLIISQNGRNDMPFYSLSPNYSPNSEEEDEHKLLEMLVSQIING